MNEKKDLEKIEVNKGQKSFFYTGFLIDKDKEVEIYTIKLEVYTFWKEQILQRRKLTQKEIKDIKTQGYETNWDEIYGKINKDL